MACCSTRTLCRIPQASPHVPRPATGVLSASSGTPRGHAPLEALRPPAPSRAPARGGTDTGYARRSLHGCGGTARPAPNAATVNAPRSGRRGLCVARRRPWRPGARRRPPRYGRRRGARGPPGGDGSARRRRIAPPPSRSAQSAPRGSASACRGSTRGVRGPYRALLWAASRGRPVSRAPGIVPWSDSAHLCMLHSIIHDACAWQKATVTRRTDKRAARAHAMRSLARGDTRRCRTIKKRILADDRQRSGRGHGPAGGTMRRRPLGWHAARARARAGGGGKAGAATPPGMVARSPDGLR